MVNGSISIGASFFIAGSGLTHAVHYLAAEKAATGMNALTNNFNDQVTLAAKKSSEATGRKEGNLEDQLRVANELLRGLEILNHDKASCP
jgi:hypothetical protein